MKIKPSKSSRVVLPVCALGFFILTLIWLSYFRQRSFDKKDSIQFAIEKNSNLAVALEQYAISTLHNADALLQMIKMEYAKSDTLNVRTMIEKSSSNHGFVAGIDIIDRNGMVKMSNAVYPADTVNDFSGSNYFLFHAHNSIDSLIISKPLISKSTGRQVLVISRRLNDSKGRFAGVAALQIDPSTFTSFYSQARLLPNDIISLIAPDGITYARRTGMVESSGEDIRKSPLFIHVAHNADSFYFAKDAIRQIPTWFSYRKLKEYPIIATVGSSEQDILGRFALRQPRYIVPRIIISVLVILFSYLITLFLLHRRKLADHLSKEEERYQRLLTEQMIAVQEREREWISRELHDNVNQVLTTVKLYLEMSAKKVDDPLILKSMQLINDSIGEIRNLSHQLSAPTLGTRSLIDSINGLIEMVGFSTNLKFTFNHARYHGPLHMSQKLALYRIIQEQLNNIIKHAEATKVWITLSQKEGNIILKVKDNGKGFDSRIKTNGMGINNIISRAKIFGGVVRIDAAPQQGCCLHVVVPVVAEKEEVVLTKEMANYE
jgi:signal transduction histidine kinase